MIAASFELFTVVPTYCCTLVTVQSNNLLCLYWDTCLMFISGCLDDKVLISWPYSRRGKLSSSELRKSKIFLSCLSFRVSWSLMTNKSPFIHIVLLLKSNIYYTTKNDLCKYYIQKNKENLNKLLFIFKNHSIIVNANRGGNKNEWQNSYKRSKRA